MGVEMTTFEPIPAETERVAKAIVDAAFQVHRALGPGLIESVYQTCLAFELHQRGLEFETEQAIPIVYKDVHLDAGLRVDILVEDRVIVELKAVETMIPLFDAQLLTYLKLTHTRLGLLINFNVSRIKEGIKRIVL